MVQAVINEDNPCPKCGFNGLFEYIFIDICTKDGEYECECGNCGYSYSSKFKI